MTIKFSDLHKAGILPKELLWPPDREDTEFLMTLGMEVLAWSLRVAILTLPLPLKESLRLLPMLHTLNMVEIFITDNQLLERIDHTNITSV